MDGQQVGAGLDDTMTIVFDIPTDQPALSVAQLNSALSSGSFGTAGNGASASWSDNKTLVVTLGSDATVKTGATVDVSSLGIKDIGDESTTSTASSAIGGTFGSQVPGITTVTAADAGHQVGAGQNDTMTIVFDTPTDQPALSVAQLNSALSSGTFGTAGNGASVSWSDNKTLVITLGSDATVKSGATVDVSTLGIKDVGDESIASTASAAIGGTFGSQVPGITSITAADGGHQVGSGLSDTVTIVFDTPTDQPALSVAQLNSALSRWKLWNSRKWSVSFVE